MNMEFQPLPPVSTMNLGGGPPTPSPSPHVQIIPNGGSGTTGNSTNQLLNSMPPPPILPVGMPLQQVVHNLQHLTNVNGLGQQQQQHQQQQQQQHQQQHPHQTLLGTNNTNGLNGIHQNQSLPPTSQLLQAIHHNQANNNNNNNAINNNNNNSITQYQVQQLWRHHAYLNGNVFECLFGTERGCGDAKRLYQIK